jgi:hypothetical protein
MQHQVNIFISSRLKFSSKLTSSYKADSTQLQANIFISSRLNSKLTSSYQTYRLNSTPSKHLNSYQADSTQLQANILISNRLNSAPTPS